MPLLLWVFLRVGLLVGFGAAPAQVSSVQLTPAQVQAIFPETVQHRLGITLPIFRVYKYTDASGQYYAVLTESQDSRDADGEALNQQIRALGLRAEPQGLVKTWELNDHILANTHEESSIWFWTKYAEFKDYDQDGLAEPLIVYGTRGLNGFDDGRIKFLIYYKGQKVAIRHQNSGLDYGRSTQVDRAFYALPASFRAAVKQKMQAMTDSGLAIFPRGWEKAMQQRKLSYHE